MQHHYDDEHIAFIRQKIENMRIALFRAESDSVLQLPNNIVQVLQANNEGEILFITSCKADYAKMIDRSFFAYLDFYKKGTGCPLKISGKAMIVEDEPRYIPGSKDVASGGGMVLVKMKIMQAEYFENKPAYEGTWKEKFKTAFYHLFLSTPHRTYNFS